MPSSKSSSETSGSQATVAVGRVSRPHGVRGALRVVLHDAGSQTLAQVAEVRVCGRPYAVRSARRLGSTPAAFLLELEGIATREAADALRGAEIEIARAEVPLAPGEYLVGDLVGCRAFDVAGRPLGCVRSIFHNGAQDVLVLDGDRMVPLCEEWVVELDLEARRLVVDLHE